MCDTCGCGHPEDAPRITRPGKHGHQYSHGHVHKHGDTEHDHFHEHAYHHHHEGGEDIQDHDHPPDQGHHDHDHHHEHPSGKEGRRIDIEADILGRNKLLAERNRGFFEARGMLALNWVSSPGSGKTTILEKTILALKESISFYIIEGDQQTMIDAERILRTGAEVIQVNTGSGCHLDAAMVMEAVKELGPAQDSVLMIENVGNLVCPALFDLGELLRIVVISTTEGNDKPLKYPGMFETSQVCIINKTDLLPYVDADITAIKKYARQVNPSLEFFEMSARTGEGMNSWLEWLKGRAGKS